MEGIAVLLAAAALGYALAKALRVSPIPLLLLSGMALGQTGLMPAELLGETLILGVTFLLFVTGIELSPGRTRGQRRVVLRVGLLQFVLLGAAGFALALALGYDAVTSSYLALALTASSTLVIVRLLRQRRQMFEPYARLVVGVLLLQDLLVILLIPVVTRAPSGALSITIGVLGVAVLVGLSLATLRWITPLLVRLDGEDEPLLLAILALLFVFIGAADALALPLVVGAFLAGVALSGFPINAVVRPQLASVGDFFSAIFFTALGALIGVPSAGELVHALLLATLVVIATPPLVTWIAEQAGLSARPAIEAGLLLAQTSELSLVIGLYGMLAGQIDESVFTVIALATLLTMVLTPLIASDRVAWALMHLHPVRRRGQIAPPAGGHVVILGSGSTGMPLLETLFGSGCEVVVVDDDPSVVARLREAEVPVIRGDATDVHVLEEARARQARIISSTIRRPEDNRRLLEYVRGVPVLVRVFEEEDAEWIRALGGTPVLYSEAAADGLLRWVDREMGGGSGTPERESGG
jgi:Kef-type K+ transport system membrane component KefB